MTSDDASLAQKAFEVLGHETRVTILVALLTDWTESRTEPVSYAELMDRVGMEDSGKFNYHLDKLRGVYVRRVEAGYVPTAGAAALRRAVLAHRPADTVNIEREVHEVSCPVCSSETKLTYERGFVTLECIDCKKWPGFKYPFPQNGFEKRSVKEVLDALDRRLARDTGLLRAGQCPECAGTLSVDLRPEATEGEHSVFISCNTCSLFIDLGVLELVHDERQVTDALETIGVDPSLPFWDLPSPSAFVDSDEPTHVGTVVEGTNGTVHIVINERIDIVSVETDIGEG